MEKKNLSTKVCVCMCAAAILRDEGARSEKNPLGQQTHCTGCGLRWFMLYSPGDDEAKASGASLNVLVALDRLYMDGR